VPPEAPKDRRAIARGDYENQATGLVEKILKDPAKAADELESNIRTTGDVTMVSALISAAASLAILRGIDLKNHVAAVRKRLRDAGFVL
jgi:hypothetical protein